MGLQLFEQFRAMVDQLPAKGVMAAVRLQEQMLKDDVARKRTVSMNDVRSITSFSQFLEKALISGVKVPPVTVPLQHLSFYRATVKRLVDEGELPKDASARFDKTFSAGAMKSLKVS